MASEELPTSWAESPYQGQMQTLMDHQWGSPSTYESVTHPYVASTHANPALLTPISASNSVYLDPRQSPTHPSSHELQYHNMNSASVSHGLGICNLNYMQPGMPLYNQSEGHNPYDPHGQLRRHAERAASERTYRAGSRPLSARSTPIAIAPNPLGIRQMEQERRLGQELETQRQPRKPRRPRIRSSILDQETNLTLQLREQNVPWNEVVKRVNATYGGNHNASRLQMRITRLKQRMREWSEDDIQALRNAHLYWETEKFEIMAHKMQEYKTTRGWTASQCQQKWQELQLEPEESLRRSQSPDDEDEPPDYPNKRPR
ncbi:predicted protein [Uncinocarpus reesii 1704]|uniref:Myb-like domain-containing protein n=1 Tax=Uncinocarpus reesii (strain UAMH 1704) TaxID=336963 RepID=C4JJI4_UNCRE|nr:uncharacterized protein UREG_01791 [Uncinocarpus reesii 1704]EEP76942.1 predicted protein [Uncinocarpus reesii 1704]